ncbi:hypothetical protein [Streptomyces sp. NBC_00268]|uniref:hypothetical protein n=1 Tax=Streptomyces sp. NBC_00268 TaxID=2975695 RepID=UPI00225C1386|nr:hypothetical protein [Streptomyces sp. NBC_00268]MCX5184350.1 hypothetical protein [Streptomyces sp. NBC_00268]
MEHGQLVAAATAAAAALVGEMAKDTWASVRSLAARLFRHAGPEEEERQLTRLDTDQAQAAALDPAVLRDRWSRRLLTLVEDFPEAAETLAELASRRQEDPQPGVNQSASNNTGSVIQIGRDNSGSLNTERR